MRNYKRNICGGKMKYLIIFLFLLIPININALEINSKGCTSYILLLALTRIPIF